MIIFMLFGLFIHASNKESTLLLLKSSKREIENEMGFEVFKNIKFKIVWNDYCHSEKLSEKILYLNPCMNKSDILHNLLHHLGLRHQHEKIQDHLWVNPKFIKSMKIKGPGDYCLNSLMHYSSYSIKGELLLKYRNQIIHGEGKYVRGSLSPCDISNLGEVLNKKKYSYLKQRHFIFPRGSIRDYSYEIRPLSVPIIKNNKVYYIGIDKNFYILKINGHELVPVKKIEGPFQKEFFVNKGIVVLFDELKNIVLLNLLNKKEEITRVQRPYFLDLHTPIQGDLNIIKNDLAFILKGKDHQLYRTFDLKKWKNLEGQLASNPIICKSEIYSLDILGRLWKYQSYWKQITKDKSGGKLIQCYRNKIYSTNSKGILIEIFPRKKVIGGHFGKNWTLINGEFVTSKKNMFYFKKIKN